MVKQNFDIEKASNGSWIVTWYKVTPNTLQALGGTKGEKEQLAFTNAQSFVKWLEKTI